MRAVARFWDRCTSEGKVKTLQPYTGSFGMLGLCAEFDAKMEGFTYILGVEAVPGATLPLGTQKVKVPAARYAVFESVGPMPHTIQNVWRRAFYEWFPTSGLEHAGAPDFEVYPHFDAGDPRGDITSPQNYSEVWVPIRKATL